MVTFTVSIVFVILKVTGTDVEDINDLVVVVFKVLDMELKMLVVIGSNGVLDATYSIEEKSDNMIDVFTVFVVFIATELEVTATGVVA